MRPIRACRPALYPQSIVGFAGLRVCGFAGYVGCLAIWLCWWAVLAGNASSYQSGLCGVFGDAVMPDCLLSEAWPPLTGG